MTTAENSARPKHTPGPAYSFIPDLFDLLADIPPNTIISREVYRDESLKAVIFGFAAGQELSEHTASKPALLHFLEGEAQVILGEDQYQAHAGTWVHMPAHLPHSILAVKPTILLLSMLS